jgi:hypothetical protein
MEVNNTTEVGGCAPNLYPSLFFSPCPLSLLLSSLAIYAFALSLLCAACTRRRSITIIRRNHSQLYPGHSPFWTISTLHGLLLSAKFAQLSVQLQQQQQQFEMELLLPLFSLGALPLLATVLGTGLFSLLEGRGCRPIFLSLHIPFYAGQALVWTGILLREGEFLIRVVDPLNIGLLLTSMGMMGTLLYTIVTGSKVSLRSVYVVFFNQISHFPYKSIIVSELSRSEVVVEEGATASTGW